MFEHATRIKLRHPTPIGLLMTEELWDLPLTNQRHLSINSMAIELNKALREQDDFSLISKATKERKELELRFSIVKHIFDTKTAEAKLKTKKAEAASQGALIDRLIIEKQNEDLKSKTIEELTKLKQDL